MNKKNIMKYFNNYNNLAIITEKRDYTVRYIKAMKQYNIIITDKEIGDIIDDFYVNTRKDVMKEIKGKIIDFLI